MHGADATEDGALPTRASDQICSHFNALWPLAEGAAAKDWQKRRGAHVGAWMFAILGCYVIIGVGTLGLLSRFVYEKLGCVACGHETKATRASRWLFITMIALTWPLLVAIIALEVDAFHEHDR
jgi:MFS family permease